jgi:hypothetical protein
LRNSDSKMALAGKTGYLSLGFIEGMLKNTEVVGILKGAECPLIGS